MKYHGSIYFVLVGSEIKIGFSENVPSRVDAFNTRSLRAKLLAVIDCPFPTRDLPHPMEVALWKRFDRFRISGEWFCDAYPLVSWISRLPSAMSIRRDCDYFQSHKTQSVNS